MMQTGKQKCPCCLEPKHKLVVHIPMQLADGSPVRVCKDCQMLLTLFMAANDDALNFLLHYIPKHRQHFSGENDGHQPIKQAPSAGECRLRP